jgi:hypothetical protein
MERRLLCFIGPEWRVWWNNVSSARASTGRSLHAESGVVLVNSAHWKRAMVICFPQTKLLTTDVNNVLAMQQKQQPRYYRPDWLTAMQLANANEHHTSRQRHMIQTKSTDERKAAQWA